MAEDFRSILKQIQTGHIQPVYFFCGEETYPIDYLLKYIREQVLDPAIRDFNFDTFQGDSAEMDEVISIARSYPMMADRRVIVIRDVHQLTTGDRNLLLGYAQSPMESTCMILVSPRADRRQKFWSELSERCVFAESKALYENQAVDWVLQRLNQKEVQITHDAARLLVQASGTSCWNLHHEIEKLITYTWGKTRITREDVLGVTGQSREYNIWEFTDSIARRNAGEALHILSRLLESKHSPAGMIMDLSRRMLNLFRLKSSKEQRVPREQMTRQVGLKPYFIKLFSEQAELFSIEEISRAIQTLYRADLALKTGFMNPVMIMTLVVYDLTRKQGFRFF